jgi:hypothetical protein
VLRSSRTLGRIVVERSGSTSDGFRPVDPPDRRLRVDEPDPDGFDLPRPEPEVADPDGSAPVLPDPAGSDPVVRDPDVLDAEPADPASPETASSAPLSDSEPAFTASSPVLPEASNARRGR